MGLESWRDTGSGLEESWYDMAGEVELAAGRFQQAEELFAAGLDAAERHDAPFFQRAFARTLRECERREVPARLRKACS